MTSVLAETRARFRDDPTAGRTAPTVTATLRENRALCAAGPFSWDADLPLSLGGTNAAPSPTAYLLGALAACGVVFVNDTLAPEFGVTVHGITAVARCGADLAGLFAVGDAVPDLTDLEIEISVDTPDPESKTAPMFEAWSRRCPIYLALGAGAVVTLRTAGGAR